MRAGVRRIPPTGIYDAGVNTTALAAFALRGQAGRCSSLGRHIDGVDRSIARPAEELR
ncbi:hypothetical protein [Methylobacterium sp. P5_C11]